MSHISLFKTIFISCLILLFAGCSTIRFTEQNLFFPFKEHKISDTYSFNRYFIITDDSVRIESWFLTRENAKINLLLFPGNGYNLRTRVPFFNKVGEELDANIFAINYRGFGLSEGSPTIKGIVKDGITALEYFKSHQQLNKGLPTFIVGYSLGSFVALNAGTENFIHGLILIGALTSAEEMISYLKNKNVPFYAKPFVRIKADKNVYQLDNLSLVKKINKPILFVHGTQDDFVPPSMSEKLYNTSIAPTKNLLLIEGANHQTVLSDEKFIEKLVDGTKKFINSIKNHN